MELGKLIKELATRAGIDVTKPEFAASLTSAVDVPDELATGIQNNFLTEATAKNHSGLDKHFKAKNLAGVDAKIAKIANEYNLTDAQKQLLVDEKNSFERVELLTKFVKENLDADFTAKAGDKKVIVDENTKLNAAIVALKGTHATELKAAKEAAENEVMNYAFDALISGNEFANAEIPKEVNVLTGKTLINQYLQSKGAKLVRKDGQLHLINATNPDLDYMENNQPVKVADLTKQVLANNKLLKVSTTTAGGNNSQRQERQQRNDGGQNQKQDTTKAVSEIRKMADAASQA